MWVYLVMAVMGQLCDGEMVMKETRIDPFTFLFEKQNLLIEKLDTVVERLGSLELTQHDVLRRLRQSDANSDEMRHTVLTISDTLNIVANELRVTDPKCECADQTVPEPDAVINSLLFNDLYDDIPDYNESRATNDTLIRFFNATNQNLLSLRHAVLTRDQPISPAVRHEFETMRASLSHLSDDVNEQKVSLLELSQYLLATPVPWQDAANVSFSNATTDVAMNMSSLSNLSFVAEEAENKSESAEDLSLGALLTRITTLMHTKPDNITAPPIETADQTNTTVESCPTCKEDTQISSEELLSSMSQNVMEKITSLGSELSARITKAEEQITGFKIYQSSAFYSQVKEIRFELAKVKEDISRTIESTGSKLGRKLDSNKMSLFTFIDAAVTSITSSAVTSSQATGMTIAKTLRNIFHHLHLQMREVSWYASPECPGMYQKVGSKCILLLESVKTTWSEACSICASLGGRVPATELMTDLTLLRPLMSSDNPGFWLKASNSSDTGGCGIVEEKIAEVPADGSIDNCQSFFNNATGVATSPCHLQLSVLCQHNHGKCEQGDMINRSFNVTTSISDLDYFLRHSKYFKF